MASPFKRFTESTEGRRGTKLPPVVLKEVYEHRFDETDQARKEAIWRELGKFFQRYIVPNAKVVDMDQKVVDRWRKIAEDAAWTDFAKRSAECERFLKMAKAVA